MPRHSKLFGLSESRSDWRMGTLARLGSSAKTALRSLVRRRRVLGLNESVVTMKMAKSGHPPVAPRLKLAIRRFRYDAALESRQDNIGLPNTNSRTSNCTMSRPQTALTRLRQAHQQLGLRGIVRTLVDRLGQRLCGLQVHDVLWLEVSSLPNATPINSALGLPVEFRFLTPTEVAAFALDPANDLDETMAERAAGGLDLCFAAISGGRLASYSWFALGSIEPAHFCGIGLSYPADMAYHYKGFTHPDFRGHRLYGAAVVRALNQLGDRCGVTRLICGVHWLNDASLKGSKRMGYRSLGRMLTTERDQVRLVHAPSAALKLGVRFGTGAEESSRSASQHSG